jgi:3-oxoacyl-[acyl-carrier protein] reductase
MRLKGKTALIAGAARNIGKAIALTYAREGADVILVAREALDALDATAKECEGLGVKVLPLLADVGDHAQVEDVVNKGLKRFDKVEVLVSVAALRPHKPFWEISYEEWNRVLAVNLHSTFYFAKALAPSMMEKRNGGSIIALGGLASMTGQPIRAHVVASKTGLYGLIKALALELGPFGVRANLIAVGHIDTARKNPEWYPCRIWARAGRAPTARRSAHRMARRRCDDSARRRKSPMSHCFWLPTSRPTSRATASSVPAADTCDRGKSQARSNSAVTRTTRRRQ